MWIDSHQHFWRYTPEADGWISELMAVIRRAFAPADLRTIAEDDGIDGSIAVQARQSVEETDWLLTLAAKDPFIKGVVGWVPLASHGLTATLDRDAASLALKGVRHVVQGEPDPEFLARPDFNAGTRAVTARDVVYDILIRTGQLPAAIAFVGRTWTPELLEPCFDVVLRAFGPRRLMFGSDWPVRLVTPDYVRWLRFVEACAAPLSDSDRECILGATAAEVDRLTI